ncbi:hypothetical protein NX059_002290 [Plenodomus lindquistii]|nr:hypothetical protein NX059_002290 [Plenodomus lindquistii]
MDNDIRPISEATFVETQETIPKGSSQNSGRSTKEDIDVKVEAITEEREVAQDDSSSSITS